MTTRTTTAGRARPACARAALDRTRLADGEPLTFVASTADVNRYGFALRSDGWRLDHYNANPVVLWMHNPYTPPIGTGRAVQRDDAVMLEGVTFDVDDDLARAVDRKFRAGYLHAVSVSWDYLEADGTPVPDYWRRTEDDIRDKLFYDLAEVSAVSVPGDPRALRVELARLARAPLGGAVTRLIGDVEHALDHACVSAADLAAHVAEAVRAELARHGVDPSSGPSSDPSSGSASEVPADTAVVAALRSLTLEGTAP